MTATVSSNPPKGWIAAGSHPASYDMSVFTEFSHSGTRCARLKSIENKINGFGTLMQSINADEYRGKRIKLSAFVKSKSVKGWAGLWMRVDVDREYVSFDNMQNRAIKGDNDWTQHEIVLDVPQESTLIAFGILLHGTGTVWLDDVEIAPVGSEVPSTDTVYATRSCGIQYQNAQATNLDFTGGICEDSEDELIDKVPTGWFKQTSGEGNITVGLVPLKDKEKDKDSEREAFISVDGEGSGSLFQAILADPYKGKRLKLSAMVKTENITGTASLFYRADVVRKLAVTYDHMEGRELIGTNDWDRHECVIDIPEGSDNIYIGAHVVGKGKVWLKDFQLTLMPRTAATTGNHGQVESAGGNKPKPRHILAEPTNLDFSDEKSGTTGSSSDAHQLPAGWMATGSHPEDYKMCIDKNTNLSGSKCALIKFIGGAEQGFGTMMQMCEAKKYLGKRLRLSAKLKSENVGWAAPWMRVDGNNGEILAFDNMQKSPINGTTEWKEYEIVLDVAPGAKAIAYGVLVSGEGKVWFSQMSLTEADSEAESTDVKEILDKRNVPLNMDFEN